MNIAQLKQMNEGVKVKGFPLFIKTARKVFQDSEKNWWQEVVLMDSSGEMIGQILLEDGESQDRQHETTGGIAKYKTNQNICIMEGEIQRTDARGKEQNKLVITECFDTATPLSFDQQENLSAEQWQKAHEEETRSKIRCWLVSSAIQAGKGFGCTEIDKAWINKCVDFVLTGE